MRMPTYSTPSRVLAGLLVLVAGLNLAGMVALESTHAIPPVLTVRTFLYLTAGPAVAAWLLERLAMATVTVGDGLLVVVRRGLRVEVPVDAIADVRPWRVPLPRGGLTVRLRSGRRLRHGLASSDPVPLLTALIGAGAVPAARARARRDVAYAHAAATTPRSRLDHAVVKFVLSPIAPALIAFNLEQHISYGGLFGQYYLEGAWPWVQTFLVRWATVGIDLLLFAGVWRAAGEAIAFGVTLAVPTLAAGVRRVVEVACRLAFWVGVPAFVAARVLLQ
jgi:apolipoprotein N-acyltransferase